MNRHRGTDCDSSHPEVQLTKIHGVDLGKVFSYAWSWAAKSPDVSTQNGAAVVSCDGMIHLGRNDLPNGTEASSELLSRPLKYLYTEHAERNAIFQAAKSGHCTEGGTMVALWASCADCARAIVQSGITTLYRNAWHSSQKSERWDESITHGDAILRNGGVEVIEYGGFIDAGGRKLRFDGREIG